MSNGNKWLDFRYTRDPLNKEQTIAVKELMVDDLLSLRKIEVEEFGYTTLPVNEKEIHKGLNLSKFFEQSENWLIYVNQDLIPTALLGWATTPGSKMTNREDITDTCPDTRIFVTCILAIEGHFSKEMWGQAKRMMWIVHVKAPVTLKMTATTLWLEEAIGITATTVAKNYVDYEGF